MMPENLIMTKAQKGSEDSQKKRYDKWFCFPLLFTGVSALIILFSLVKFWVSSESFNFQEYSVLSDSAAHTVKTSLSNSKDPSDLSQVLFVIHEKYHQIDNMAIILQDDRGVFAVNSVLKEFPLPFDTEKKLSEYLSRSHVKSVFVKERSNVFLIFFVPIDFPDTAPAGYLACRFQIEEPFSLILLGALIVFWIFSFALLFIYYRYNRIVLNRLLGDREKSRIKARDQAIFLETLINTIPVPIFYKDYNGVYRGCNYEYARSIVGTSPDEIIGHNIEELPDLYPTDLVEKIRCLDRELLENPGVQCYESEVLCADGQRREFKFNKATFGDEDDCVYGIVGVMLDITRQKNIEKDLRRSEYLAHCLINANRDVALLIDCQGRILAANQVLADIVKIDPRHIKGQSLYDLYPTNVLEIYLHNIRKTIDSKSPREFPVWSNNRCFQILLYPVFDITSNEVESLAIFGRDITDHIGQMEELKRNEETTRALLNAPDELAALIDRDSNVLLINDAGAELLKVKPDEIIGTCLHYLMPPEVSDYRCERLETVIETGQPVRFQDSMYERWYENRIYPVIDEFNKVSCLALYSRDITEKMELEEDNIRLKYILDSAPDIIVFFQYDGLITYLNKKARENLDIKVGDNFFSYSDCSYYLEEDFNLIQNTGIPIAREKGEWVAEVTIKDKSGKDIKGIQIIKVDNVELGQHDNMVSIIRDHPLAKTYEKHTGNSAKQTV